MLCELDKIYPLLFAFIGKRQNIKSFTTQAQRSRWVKRPIVILCGQIKVKNGLEPGCGPEPLEAKTAEIRLQRKGGPMRYQIKYPEGQSLREGGVNMRNKSLLRKILLPGVALCLAVSMLAFAAKGGTDPTTKPTPKYGGILKRCLDVDAQGLDPMAQPFTYVAVRMAQTAIETLVRLDERGLPVVPWLATDWKVSGDLRSITFTLRKGVKFHDGTDFNAEAVKWNLERYRTSSNLELKAVASIDVLNDSTLRLNLSKWNSSLLSSLSCKAGMMISPTAYKTHGEEWVRMHPVGTGPFKFVSWQRDVKQVYQKFDSYWQKGKPYLDGIEWSINTDPVSKVFAFKQEEVDELLNVEPKDVKDLKANGKYYAILNELTPLELSLMGTALTRIPTLPT